MNAITRIPTDDAQPIAGIGHNGGPAPTAFEKAEAEVSKLYEEASLWLDGAKVDSQELADGIANLLNMIRAAEKAADTARKADKEPHLEAGRAVDAQYRPVLERAKLAADACKKALAPWLEAKEAERQAELKRKQEEAAEAQRKAEEAMRARDAANLEQAAEAEALVKDAKKAAAAAKKVGDATAKAGNSTFGRAVSTRTIWTASMTNSVEALKHYRATKPEELKAFLLSLAEADVRSGVRDIPGFSITSELKVV